MADASNGQLETDVAVLGAGFGGSLTAMLLERIGLRTVLIDRGSHPRFAIGESSTPIGNLVLRDLAQKYDLPRLLPLAKYGTWQDVYPQVACGPKRGFSYFKHHPDQPFAPTSDHANELLVAASLDLRRADTHWLRSEVDEFLAREASLAGVPYLDRTDLTIQRRADCWQLSGQREGRPINIRTRLLVDATGPAAVVPRTLGIPVTVHGLRTNSRAIYGHFTDVQPWRDCLSAAGGKVEDHPFPCDQAALHHVLDQGWMWQLPFNNGVTSVGFALDNSTETADLSSSALGQWDQLLRQYPAVAAQLDGARLVAPEGGLQVTARMQRQVERLSGEGWVVLPHTAGFIDPLHSTGIAQTLCGIERLIGLLAEHWQRKSLAAALNQYAETVQREFRLIDRLVHGCYQTLRRFELFAACSMLYFAAATTYERRRIGGQLPRGGAFLCADDADLVGMIEEMSEWLGAAARQPAAMTAAQFQSQLAQAVAPFNHAGLCDPACHNMYRYTAVP